jgi:hypothetical protein
MLVIIPMSLLDGNEGKVRSVALAMARAKGQIRRPACASPHKVRNFKHREPERALQDGTYALIEPDH